MVAGGEGDPLLVLHGAEGNRGWRRRMARLAERFTIYAPTHPGFGSSACMFPMLPYSGMRRESVATLKVRCLDGQWGLRSVRVKGGKTRDLPLPW